MDYEVVREFTAHERIYRVGETHTFAEWPAATREEEIQWRLDREYIRESASLFSVAKQRGKRRTHTD